MCLVPQIIKNIGEVVKRHRRSRSSAVDGDVSWVETSRGTGSFYPTDEVGTPTVIEVRMRESLKKQMLRSYHLLDYLGTPLQEIRSTRSSLTCCNEYRACLRGTPKTHTENTATFISGW